MKEYQIIYADPPWTYRVWSANGSKRSASQHYSTMSKEELQQIPIQKLSANNSVLLIWITAPCLEQGLELIKKWGFIYKTIGFTWIKKNRKSNGLFWGMGHYTRSNAELCLLATKGKPLKRASRAVHQVVESPIREHSRKPDEVRSRITKLFGDLSRIELFARHKADGWDSIGKDIDGEDINAAIAKLCKN